VTSLRRRAVPLLLLLAAACGNAAPDQERVLAAAGETANVEAPATTTTTPPTTSTTAAPVTTTTTSRPAPTPTSAAPAVVRTTVAPRPAPAPPPPGVEPWGYGGLGGRTTASAGGTTAALQVYPRQQYAGEPVQVSVEVTTPSFVTAKVDRGNGVVHEATLTAKCQPTPYVATGGPPPFYVYPAPGDYVIRLIVTVIPCMVIPGPPGSPYGAPDPVAPRQTVEVSMAFHQRAEPPPRPVGPPPGA
jgi:hypothetical protein